MAPRSPHDVAQRSELITGMADGTPLTFHCSARVLALPVLPFFGHRRSESSFGQLPAIAEGLEMLSFKVPTASGSISARRRTGKAALAESRVLRRPRSSSTRPEITRSRLTPACSGLASLAADARR
jgi:hypothetical protein